MMSDKTRGGGGDGGSSYTLNHRREGEEGLSNGGDTTINNGRIDNEPPPPIPPFALSSFTKDSRQICSHHLENRVIMSESDPNSNSTPTTTTSSSSKGGGGGGGSGDGSAKLDATMSSESFWSPQGKMGEQLDVDNDLFATPPSDAPTSVNEPFPTRLSLTPHEGSTVVEKAVSSGGGGLLEDNPKPKPDKPPRRISAEKLTMKQDEVWVVEPPPRPSQPHPSSKGGDYFSKMEEVDLPPPPPTTQTTPPSQGERSAMHSTPSMRKGSQSQPFPQGLSPLARPGEGRSKGHFDDDDDKEDRSLSRRSSHRPSFADMSAAVVRFTGRQWICLIVFGLADLFAAMVVSLQAPFYPSEAERKGATASEYGLVFGLYELIIFTSSPIYGKYINKIGPKVVFNTGIFVTAMSCVAFGLLDKVNDHTLFITLSFIFRITEALGASAFTTSSFTIIACEFPDSVATTFASLETFFGLGLIVGPSVGGALFEVGGYILPFVVTGFCLFLIGLIAAIIMPKIETVYNDGEATVGYGICSILRIPGIAVAATAMVVMASSVGVLSATLEPHLRPFGLSPLQIGLMFIIYGGVYAFTAPIVGWFCDRVSTPVYIILVGGILVWVGFLLIGPAPFIPLETTVWVTAIGLAILGLGISGTLVAAFILCLSEAMEHGFPDNVSTYGVVSALWTSSVSLGAFLGPSIGGFLYDTVTFRPGTYYVFASEGLVIVMLIVYILARPKLAKKRRSVAFKDEETAPLLRSLMIKEDVERMGVPSGGSGSCGGGYGTIM